MKGVVSFAHKSLGVEVWPGQREVLGEWAASNKRKGVLILGRRSGKGLMGSCVAIKNAVDHYPMPRPNELRSIVCVANRQEQASEFIRTCRELLEAAPDRRVKSLVDWTNTTQDEIRFHNQVRIMAMPCSSRSTRGLAVSLLIMDEAGWMSTSEDGFAAGKQVYNALAPGTAQFGAKGYILLLSTPNWRSGILWDLYEQGQAEGSDVFVAQRPTWSMNPNVSRELLEPEFRADPDSANREYGASFSAAAGAYLGAPEVLACVRKGNNVLPPVEAIQYAAALDPGYLLDAFAMAAVHRESETGRIVVDGTWSWLRHGHEVTLDAVAEISKSYRIRILRTDQASSQPIREGLAKRGLSTNYVPWTSENKADAYGKLKILINTGGIELPNDDRLLQELFSLEARPTPSGMTRIAAAANGHDDLASALAGAIAQLGNAGSAADLEGIRTLMHNLAKRGPFRSTFEEVAGIAGLPRTGFDRLNG